MSRSMWRYVDQVEIVESHFVIGLTGVVVASSNPRRKSIAFTSPGSVVISLSLHGNVGSGSAAFSLLGNNYPMVFRDYDWGDGVQGQWIASTTVGGIDLSVWEAVYVGEPYQMEY